MIHCSAPSWSTPGSPRPSHSGKVQKKLACPGDRFWVPADKRVAIAGYDVGGMLYAGSGLPPVSLQRVTVEPALLDPRLAVGKGIPDRQGRFMSYWPAYAAIHPDSRMAFLEWLAGGRGPGAYIGYVFLFFYGIERRVLTDAAHSRQARAEVDGLLAEVARLRELYPESSSFQAYARNFLSFARHAYQPVRLEALEPPWERVHYGEPPLTVRLALGMLAKYGRPIPVEWALSWLLTAPEVYLRTPAARCPDEFRELFEQRYLETFGGIGLVIPPVGGLTLTAQYHPASPSFSGHILLKLDLPEVTAYPSLLQPIRDIADGVVQDLETYSRWIGRAGVSGDLAALTLLPAELAYRVDDSEQAVRLAQWVETKLDGRGMAVVPGAELLQHWPARAAGKLTRREAEMLAIFLGRRGYGLEPDARFGAWPSASSPAVLFRLAPDAADPDEPSPACHAAALLLRLAAAVSVVDGRATEQEERHLLAHLESSLHLSDAERTRLKAYLRWLLAVPPGLTGIKKRVAPLPLEQRRGIGQFLIGVAGADGHIGPKELKLLIRIYALLGFDTQAVYSDVHALASGAVSSEQAALEPVTVRPAEPAADFPIPKPSRARSKGVDLDLAKVQAKLAETAQVSSFLEEIFREEAPSPPPRALPWAESGQPVGPQTNAGSGEGPKAQAGSAQGNALGGGGEEPLLGLDAPHTNLLLRLGGQDAWPREDIERLARDLGLLPDGALEVINEAAFAVCGVPLLEGDEMIEIDRQVFLEMTAS